MTNGLLLWVDDEVDLLKAHILFLEKKGYEVETVNNGMDAIERCQQRTYDLILLDEMMPGITGLETLQRIKEVSPATPVVMVTKSEEEDIMNQAIGSKIADYLIKPVNPNQILLSLKKNIHRKEIESEVTQSGYQQNFMEISAEIRAALGELALRIEHVGSTSVRGLSAKPIIDLDVVIRDDSVFETVVSRLRAIGYRHEGDLGIPGREAFAYEGKDHLRHTLSRT